MVFGGSFGVMNLEPPCVAFLVWQKGLCSIPRAWRFGVFHLGYVGCGSGGVGFGMSERLSRYKTLIQA